MRRILVSLFLLASLAPAPAETLAPLFKVVDLNRGETVRLLFTDNTPIKVTLLEVKEQRCDQRDAVRQAAVKLQVDDREVWIHSALYHLPQTVGRVQIDCPVTRGYTKGSSNNNVWALEKDARLRIWPEGSPWLRPGSFGYPVNQRWFASDTQMANDPCYVNACDLPGKKTIYYHYGLDFGGAEHLVNILAATDGTVVSRGGKDLSTGYPPQVKKRHDVVYLKDQRGWYYRYSHLASISDTIKLGDRIKTGTVLGTLGKEGGSGGWTHLHFDITMMQPSGKHGITDGYPFIFEAWRNQAKPELIAVARPHQIAWVGDEVQLDASRTWHKDGVAAIDHVEWRLQNGSTIKDVNATVRYEKPGHYTETLLVKDKHGAVSYDFCVVQVFKKDSPTPPSIHPTYWPTENLKPNQEITFKVRTFAVKPDEGEETWDFGDGSPPVTTRSDGNAKQHNPNGYAITKHRYAKAGDYLVAVHRTNARDETATGRLWVSIQGD